MLTTKVKDGERGEGRTLRQIKDTATSKLFSPDVNAQILHWSEFSKSEIRPFLSGLLHNYHPSPTRLVHAVGYIYETYENLIHKRLVLLALVPLLNIHFLSEIQPMQTNCGNKD